MNAIKGALYAISLICFFTIFTACTGQNKSKSLEDTIDTGATMPLLGETIWAIYQDKKSNYWFGSKENGVFYYDGQLLKHITVEDGLVSNEIRGIQEDSNGNIFFDTEQGVSKFDGQSFKTLPIMEADAPTDKWILKPSDLWFRIGSNKSGVYRFDGEYLHYLKFPKSPQEDEFYRKNSNTSLRPYGLYTIYKDRKGSMWFGTSGLGVCRFDGKSITWHYEDQLQTTPSGGDFGTRAIFEDRDGLFWINNTRFRYDIVPHSTNGIAFKKESGIGYVNQNKQMEFPFFFSITQDDDGNLWMVTYNNGVWKYDGNKLIHYPVKDGETNAMLFTIYKDQQGTLWLGTFNAGVYTFNGHSFDKFAK